VMTVVNAANETVRISSSARYAGIGIDQLLAVSH
jgi:hypothetical protein